MPINPIDPINGAGFGLRPYAPIRPFIFVWGRTHADTLEDLRKYVYSEIVEHLNTENKELNDSLNSVLDQLATQISNVDNSATAAAIEAKAARDEAETFAGQTQVLQDNAVKTLAATPGTEFRTQLDSMYRVVLPSPGSTVDVMPIIQTLYDLGVRVIDLKFGDVYYFNSVVFLDNEDPRSTFRFNGNGAVEIVGPNAGRPCTPYSGTPGTKFLFYVNTKRTNAAIVPVNEDTSATGKYTATVGSGLIVNDGDFRGQGQPVGQLARIAMYNNSSPKFNNTRTSWLSGLYATAGYTDSATAHDCRVTNPTSLDTMPGIAEQQSNGDAFVITSGNSDAKGMIVNARYTRGATLVSPVGGSMKWVDCRDVVILGAHIEGDEKTRQLAPLRIGKTLASVRDSEFWVPKSTQTFAAAEIADGTTNLNGATDLLLENVTFVNAYRADGPNKSVADEASQAEINIMQMNTVSVLRARNVWSITGPVESTDVWRSNVRVISADPAIQSALTTGAALIATGSWDLKHVGGSWQVTPPNSRLVEVSALVNAPTIDGVASTNDALGTIAAGDYTYRFAMLDGNDVYSNSSASFNVTLSKADGNAARIIAAPSRSGRIAVWRKGSAQATPDRYAVFGVGSRKLFLYDTGDNINKRAWNKDNVPAIPPSTGSLSVDTLKFGTRTI